MDLSDTAASPSIKIWDVPVRITHWGFVTLLPGLWWTAEERDMTLHKQLGLITLALVVFWILWGFLGSSTARFSQFLAGPRKVLEYVRSIFGKRSPALSTYSNIGKKHGKWMTSQRRF